MNKIRFNSKRIIALMLCLSCAAGMLCISGCGKKVNTYSVSEIAYVDSWMDNSETYGDVRTNNMQNIYASETIKILEIFVEEGQEVKKGDKLMTYDTALTDIELEKKELEVMQLQLDLQNAERELRTINSYKPMVITMITPPAGPAGTEITGCVRTGGSGTEEDPYIFVAEDGKIPCGGSFVESICPPGTDNVWAVFQKRANNMSNGIITEYWGICYSNGVSGPFMTFFDAFDFCQNVPTEPYEEVEMNSGLTAGEISQMRADAKERIEEAKYKYRMADIEYQQMKLEMDNGVVTAQLDGKIVALNDPETAIESGEPVLKLSQNGGYIVEGTLSELELEAVKVGQKVKVTSWESYSEYEAEIESVSTIPAAQNGWTNGNTNVSYYPFTVTISGDANLKENEYVSITYSSKGSVENSFYLELPFVISEGGRNYVFVQTEDGTLEKRAIETGEIMWGSYVRIISGLTTEDRIAFPYDKNAKNGAKVREASVEELYSY